MRGLLLVAAVVVAGAVPKLKTEVLAAVVVGAVADVVINVLLVAAPDAGFPKLNERGADGAGCTAVAAAACAPNPAPVACALFAPVPNVNGVFAGSFVAGVAVVASVSVGAGVCFASAAAAGLPKVNAGDPVDPVVVVAVVFEFVNVNTGVDSAVVVVAGFSVAVGNVNPSTAPVPIVAFSVDFPGSTDNVLLLAVVGAGVSADIVVADVVVVRASVSVIVVDTL